MLRTKAPKKTYYTHINHPTLIENLVRGSPPCPSGRGGGSTTTSVGPLLQAHLHVSTLVLVEKKITGASG